MGVPLNGVEVRIGEDDELLVKTPGRMLGYWNNHAATAEMIDPDGWLHTGDQARIEHGHIYITGRLKDILVLSNGEKVPPMDMEMAICLDPLIDQALVVGEGRPYLSAILVLNPDGWLGLARHYGLDDYAEASLENEKLRNHFVNVIRQQPERFPRLCEGAARDTGARTLDGGQRPADADAQGETRTGAGEIRRPHRGPVCRRAGMSGSYNLPAYIGKAFFLQQHEIIDADGHHLRVIHQVFLRPVQ